MRYAEGAFPSVPASLPTSPRRVRPMSIVSLGLLLTAVVRAEDRPDATPIPPAQALTSAQLTLPAPAEPVAAALAEIAQSWLWKKCDAGLQVVDLETGEEVFGLG